ERHLRLHLAEEIALLAPDAVLGGDRAAQAERYFVNHAIDLVFAGRVSLGIRPDRLSQVVVDVAVAEMAEGADADAGHRLRAHPTRLLEDLRHLADGHRDVVADARAFRLLRIRDRLAQLPERLRLRAALGDRAVEHGALLHPRREPRLQP